MRKSKPFNGDRADKKLVKIQQANTSLMLNTLKRELQPRCLLNDDMNSNPFIACFCGHLSFKPGSTSTKSSGLSPRTISRKIVESNSSKPTIPAGAWGEFGDHLKTPPFAVACVKHVALSAWCLLDHNIFRLRDV